MSEDVGVDFRLFLEQYKNDIEQIKAGLDGIDKKAKEEAEQVSSHFKKAAGLLAGYFTFDAAKGFAAQIINVRGELEQLEAVMGNSLQSNEEAAKVMGQLNEVVTKTPSTLSELGNGFLKLTNQNLRPTMDELIKISDIAAYSGKSLDQLTEAIIDAAASGENERLKEFGVRAKNMGDTIQYTFRGITTEVQNNAAAIKEYIYSLGDLEGVKGASATIMGTIPGMISNLQVAIEQMFNDMGTGAEGVIKDTIGWTTRLVENWKNVVDILKVIIATYGAYKAATIVTGIMNQVQAAGSLTKALRQTAIAQKALNMLQASNPYGLALAGITALMGALVLLNKNTDKTAAMMAELDKEIDKTFGKESANLNILGQQLKDTNLSQEQRKKIIGEINTQYAEYLPNLLTDKDTNEEIAAAIEATNEQLRKKIEMQALQQKATELYAQKEEMLADLETKTGMKRLAIMEAIKAFVPGMSGIFSLFGKDVAENLKNTVEAYEAIMERLKTVLKEDIAGNPGPNIDTTPAIRTIKDIEAELSVLEKKYKEATDISDTAELEKLKKLILDKRAEIEQFKIEAQKTRDPLAEFKKELDKQKQLYAEYEAVKSEISLDEADKMYAGLLQKGATYEEYLRGLLTGNLNNGQKGIVAVELKGVTKNNGKNDDKDDDYFKKLVEETEGYYEQIDKLETNYANDRRLLEEAGLTSHIAALDNQYNATRFNIEQQAGAYNWLYKSTDNYNRKALKGYIARIQKELELSEMSAEQRIEFEKHLAAAQEKLDQKLAQNLGDVANILGEAANLAAEFDENLAEAVNTASELAGAAAGIAGGLASGNPVAVITGVIQAVTTIVELINKDDRLEPQEALDRVEESFKRIDKVLNDIDNKIDSALGLEKIAKLNAAVQTSVALTKKLANNYLDVWRAVSRSNDHKFGYDENKELQRLQAQHGKGTKEFYEAILSSQIMLDHLNQEQIEILQQQLAEYDKLEAAARDYKNQLHELMTGTTFDSMRDELVSMFNDGKTAVEDFTEYFETLMKKAIIESLSVKYLDEKLQGWYDAWGVAFEDGVLTDEERAALKKMFDETINPVVEQINEATKMYNDIAETDTSSGTTGSIQSITQETASIMAGHLGNMRLNLAALVQGAAKNLEVLNRMDNKLGNIERYTKDTRDALHNTSF